MLTSPDNEHIRKYFQVLLFYRSQKHTFLEISQFQKENYIRFQQHAS